MQAILRPKIILIEQVAAFHSHPHRAWIEKALWFAGYQLRFAHVIKLSDVMPVKRARWLGVAYFVHEPDIHFPALSSWSIERVTTLLEFDCVRAWPPDILMRLKVPDDAIQQAQSLPMERAAKSRKRYTADEAVATHTFRATDTCLPTFMAQHGNQHRLQDELLETRGYFTHWLKEAEDLRDFAGFQQGHRYPSLVG